MKRGILLLNFGGPAELKDVRPFLYRLFSDKVIIDLPTPFRQTLAHFIAFTRAATTRKMYAQIGGGSPQLKWTNAQLTEIQNQLGSNIKVTVGNLTSAPDIGPALKDLKDWGAEKVVFLPLFPQFSTTTIGACYQEVDKVLAKMNWQPREQVRIKGFPDHPKYIELLRQTINESLATVAGKEVHVLFSAHSLPLTIIEKGDPYPAEIQKTIVAITSDLTVPWSLAFQSRSGKRPWLEPYTDDEIRKLAASGVKTLIVVPISFISDHIETLYELDLTYQDVAKKAGVENYLRTRCFNGDPKFSQTLLSIIQDHAPL